VLFVHGSSGTVAGLGAVRLSGSWRPPDLTSTVVSFSYSSRPWERAAISQAADDLKTWLDTELQAYRHLVFVTHSSGGLVVKDMLRGAVHDGHVAIPTQTPRARYGYGPAVSSTSPCHIRAGRPS
jgi:hypothetical protein